MEQRENTFAMSQCMLTKQYGKYKAVIQFSAVDRPETEEKVLSLIMGAYEDTTDFQPDYGFEFV